MIFYRCHRLPSRCRPRKLIRLRMTAFNYLHLCMTFPNLPAWFISLGSGRKSDGTAIGATLVTRFFITMYKSGQKAPDSDTRDTWDAGTARVFHPNIDELLTQLIDGIARTHTTRSCCDAQFCPLNYIAGSCRSLLSFSMYMLLAVVLVATAFVSRRFACFGSILSRSLRETLESRHLAGTELPCCCPVFVADPVVAVTTGRALP